MCASKLSVSLVLWLGDRNVLDDRAPDGDPWTLQGQAEASALQEQLCWPLDA